MKLKDIEKKLKEENSQVKVPDVLARVKKAPINRLLTPPAQAFKKRLAIQLLCFAFILILAVMFTVITMLFVPSAEENGVVFVKITVENEDGNTSYGMCMFGDSVQKASILSVNGEYLLQDVSAVGNDIKSTLQDVYLAKDNDKVSICVLSGNEIDKNKAVDIAHSAIAEMYGDKQGLVIVGGGESACRKDLAKFLQSQGIDADESENTKSLIEKLNLLFS